jgi:hypothetical protein
MTRNQTISFANDPDDEGPVARMLEDAPAGSFVEIGKRIEGGVTHLTMKLHVPGRGAHHAGPLALKTGDGRPISYKTGVDLVSALLEAHVELDRMNEKRLAS